MKRGRKKQLIKNGKKKCSRCKKWLPFKKFSKDRSLSSSYRSHCKECQFKEEHTPKGIYWNLKNGKSEKRKIGKYDFIKWYEKQRKICVYCGVREKDIIGKQSRLWKVGRLQIDRKDNNKGYEKGNMVLACPNCNFIKGDYFSYKEMLKIGKVIKEIQIKTHL